MTNNSFYIRFCFRCNSGKCIPERYRCDKQQDCDENEDEIHCDYNITKTCATDEFTCDSGACILVNIHLIFLLGIQYS